VTEVPPIALIIEDDQTIRRLIRNALQAEGWSVLEADNWMRGATLAGTREPDLVLLDLGLPDGDGITFIRDLRAWSNVPIIIVSGRSSETSKTEALEAGADDYLSKPFDIAELMGRVGWHQQNHDSSPPDTVFRFGNVEVNQAQRTILRGGRTVQLTLTEYRLLSFLIKNVGRVATHHQITQEVWGPLPPMGSHYACVVMGGLTRKLEDDPSQPKHLQAEAGVGFRLVL
jgi:two-component system KDP operon response regulator KdpE